MSASAYSSPDLEAFPEKTAELIAPLPYPVVTAINFISSKATSSLLRPCPRAFPVPSAFFPSATGTTGSSAISGALLQGVIQTRLLHSNAAHGAPSRPQDARRRSIPAVGGR